MRKVAIGPFGAVMRRVGRPQPAMWPATGRKVRMHSQLLGFVVGMGSMRACRNSPAREGGSLQEKVMKNLLSKLVKDEQGGEVLEYALIVGLIVVAAIAAVTSVGTKVLAKWTSLNSSL
jgi:pilus assembly protein Flp/PilA